MLVRTVRRNRTVLPSRRQLNVVNSRRYNATKSAAPALLDTTYQEIIDNQIRTYDQKDLLRAESYRWTFKRFQENADALARGLIELPSHPSSNYVTATGLRVDLLVGQVSAARIGRRIVPLRPMRGDRLEAELKVSSPFYFLWSPKVGNVTDMDSIYNVFPQLELVKATETYPVSDSRFPHLKQVVHTAKRPMPGLLAHRNLLWYSPGAYDPLTKVNGLTPKEDSAYLVTDNLQLLALSEYNLLNTGNLVGHLADITSNDIVITTIPLHTAAGLALGMPLTLARKSQIVLGADAFNANDVLETAAKHLCTTLIAFPDEWLALAEKASNKPQSLVKGIIVQQPGRTISQENVEKIKKELNLEKLVTTFGTDETSGVCLVNGQPLPHTEIKVIDNSGKPAEQGQLLLKGFNVFNGYRNDEAATKSRIKDNWLSTGVTVKLAGGKVVVN